MGIASGSCLPPMDELLPVDFSVAETDRLYRCHSGPICFMPTSKYWYMTSPALTLRAKWKRLQKPSEATVVTGGPTAIDVPLPTVDGRRLILPRYTQPEADAKILLDKLRLALPSQLPPRITSVKIEHAALRGEGLTKVRFSDGPVVQNDGFLKAISQGLTCRQCLLKPGDDGGRVAWRLVEPGKGVFYEVALGGVSVCGNAAVGSSMATVGLAALPTCSCSAVVSTSDSRAQTRI